LKFACLKFETKLPAFVKLLKFILVSVFYVDSLYNNWTSKETSKQVSKYIYKVLQKQVTTCCNSQQNRRVFGNQWHCKDGKFRNTRRGRLFPRHSAATV